jgi:hypothetical protein
MKTKTKIASLAVALLSVSGASYAAAPANSVITNTASLVYTGSGGAITATVDVSIGLVVSAPTVTDPSDSTVSENSAASYTYTITSNANGPDTYNIAYVESISGAPDLVIDDAFNHTPTSVTLGASALNSAVTGSAILNVPQDNSGNTADATVNGLQVGDTVVVGGTTTTIATIVETASSATITLNDPVTAAQGAGLFEQQTFALASSDVGNLVGAATTADVTHTTNVTSATTPGAFTTAVIVVTTVNENVPTITFNKYVRNFTTSAPAVGVAAVSIDIDGAGPILAADYYPSGASSTDHVPAVPGNVLEYVIIANATGTGDVTGAQITDTVPVFTTYIDDTTTLNGAAVGTPDSGVLPLIATLSINTPGAAAGTLTGAITPGNDAIVTFRVTVQP